MPPMSTRVTSAITTGVDAPARLQALAALTPKKEIVVQLLNEATSDQSVFVLDEVAGVCFTTTLTAQSLTSFKWGGSGEPLVTSGGQKSGAGGERLGGAGWMVVAASLFLALVMGA